MVNIIGIIFSIISVALSIYFYRNRKGKRRIDFIWNHNILQRRYHDEVHFIYEGHEINSLAQLSILMLNSGDIEIRKEDIPEQFVLQILASKRIFSTQIVFTSAEGLAVTTETIDGSSFCIGFNYLNEFEGAILEILYDHDGTDHKDEDGYKYFTVIGDVIGGEPPRAVYHHNYGLFSSSFGDIVTRVTVIVAFIGLDLWFFSMERYGWSFYFTLALLSGSIQLYRDFPSIKGKKFPKFAKAFFART